jgi:translation initiation factor IF-1
MFDPYVFALALGGTGLLAMAVVGGHGRIGGGRGAGHAGGHHPGVHHGGVHHGAARHAPGGSRWSVLLSPRIAFSVLVGFGGVGLALRALLAGPWLFAAAVAGGIAFEAAIVGPTWNLLLRFGSEPALMLEHGIMDDAEAATSFNADGDGLVKLVLDGQVVQLLGTLSPEERATGVKVRAGDRLVIETVDSARQRCTVSRRGLT